ncbi:S8 family peptidase [bacterium]|nr:S8 family peptidase [bacterium]
MRRTPIMVTVLLCLFVSQVGRAERYVLEVETPLARDLRDKTSILSASLKVEDPSASLSPLFPPPKNPDRLASYYARGLDRWFVLEASTTSPIVATLRSNQAVTRFSREQLDMIADVTPDDYFNHDLWYLDALQMPEAWQLYNGPRKVTLAVIDAGFDSDHPDLAPNFRVNPAEDLNGNGQMDESDQDGLDNDENGYVDDIMGFDFVSVTESYFQDGFEHYYAVEGEDYGPNDNAVYPDVAGHGTHVAGCAGAATDNGIGVASPAWTIDLMPLRAAFTCERQSGERITTGWATDFAQAIYYAASNGARVITFSYSRTCETQSVHSAIQYANDLGVLFFSSAGNRGTSTPVYPAAYPEAIAVTALNPDGVKPSWASVGSWVELCAPGTNIWSTMSRDVPNPAEYCALSGTSMATPLVASVAALAFSANPMLLAHEVRTLLFETATNVDSLNPVYTGALGAGLVNAHVLLFHAQDMIISPDSLQIQLDDRNGTVRLDWRFLGNDIQDNEFSHFEIVRDGEVSVETGDETFSDQLGTFGYHTYRVDAVYDTGERRSSDTAAIFYIGPFGAVPEMEQLEVVDRQFGRVQAQWSRGTVTGVHQLHELRYDTDSTHDYINMPFLGAGMRVTPNAPCRLLQVRFYARVQQTGQVFVDLFPFEGTSPATTPIASASAIVDSGEGWQLVDFYGESIAFNEEMVICVRPVAGTMMQLGTSDNATDRAWLPLNSSTWQMQDDTYAIRALIAIRDEDKRDIGPGNGGGGVPANGKTDDTTPWCTYTFYDAGQATGSTMDTLYSTQLIRTGQSDVRLHAQYANGASTWSATNTVEWDRGTEHFQPVEPTRVSQAAIITNVRIDNRIPAVPVEIGVFDDELCVGAIRIEPGSSMPCSIALWQKDDQQQRPGYRPGDEISYRLWTEESEEDEERVLMVVQENGWEVFGGDAPRVSLYSYIPQPPSHFSILDPDDNLILQPDDDTMLSFSWSYAEDPDPFQSSRYDFFAHLRSPEHDTLLSFSLTSRSYIEVNLPVSAGINQWSDTLTADIWVEAFSPPDRVRSDNTILVHFLSEFSGPVPNQFQLGQAYPNPFNGFVNLPLALPEKGVVHYELYDLLGRQLAQREALFNAGYHVLQLGDDLHDAMPGSGVYFLRVKQGDIQQVQKLVHMK